MPEAAVSEARAARRQLEDKLAELFASGPEGEVRVLDVACGKGPATGVLIGSLAVHRPLARRVSLDIVPGEVFAGRAVAAGLRGGEGGWLCADILNLPFPDESVDYVVALNIFHGIDHHGFGREIGRVLRPGGRTLLYDRVPQLLPFSRFALILGRDQVASLARLPKKT